MLGSGQRVGVAVSGGADSVVLLHILKRLADELALDLKVLHINHLLRGDESDGDEEFVRQLSDRLGLELLVERARPVPGNLEQEARDLRRRLFKQWMDGHRFDRVALGHTRSDQAETVLFRLLRGSGLAGLAGMRPVTEDGLIRPLLTIGRQEVREWAISEGLTWREDSSNENLEFARNRLRLETIPALAAAYNSNLEGVLDATARLAQAEEEYWNRLVSETYVKIAKRTVLGSYFQIAEIQGLELALRRRLIRFALCELRGDLRSIDFDHVEVILHTCESSQGHDRVIVPGADAIRSYGCLLLTRPGSLSSQGRGYDIPLKMGEEVELPWGAGTIQVTRSSPTSENCVNFKVEQDFSTELAYLECDALVNPVSPDLFHVRNWEPGDSILLPGHQKATKIKELFQEFRVLLWERRHWPVVMLEREVVWVRRFGVSAAFSGSQKSGSLLCLAYQAGDGSSSGV